MPQELTYPWWNELSDEQKVIVLRRLELERQSWELRKQMCDGKQGCQHVVIRGRVIYSPAKEKIVWTHEGLADDWNDGCYSAYCAICDHDFGWWCPKSPDHYCHYEKNGWDCCDYCGEPDERK